MKTGQRRVLIPNPAPKILGALGSVLIFLGIFLPAVDMPILGAKSLIQARPSEAAFLLGVSLVSLVLSLTRFGYLCFLTSAMAILGVGSAFISIETRLEEARVLIENEAGSKAAAAIGKTAFKMIDWEYSWIVLAVAILLLIASAVGGWFQQVSRNRTS